MSDELDKNISGYQSETEQLTPETLTNQQTIKNLKHIGISLSNLNDSIKEVRTSVNSNISNTKDSILYEINIKQKELELKIAQSETRITDKINQILVCMLGLILAILCAVVFK